MLCSRASRHGILSTVLLISLWGCGQPTPSHPLDADLARSSVQRALQAWVDGKTPKEVQAEFIVGDVAWEQGKKLVSFEILTDEETSDGSNLHIRVKRKLANGGVATESQVTYIVGTSPVVTIFPQ